jgi:hypothetical protein
MHLLVIQDLAILAAIIGAIIATIAGLRFTQPRHP